MWSLKKFTSAYLFQIAREKSCDYLLIIHLKKPLTIHLLLRYTEDIALYLLKLGKASKISGDLRRSPEIVGRDYRKCSDDLRKYSKVIFGSVRVIFGKLWKCSGDLRKHSVVFGRSSEIFGRFRVVFGGLRKASYGLRKSSEGFTQSSAVFEIQHRLASGSLRFNFGYLRCNLHSCFTFLHCVTLFCTMLTKNALLFSQSEPSNFFKCIIK